MLFSAELQWCFLCRNRSSRNWTKLFDNFFGPEETPEALWKDQKSHEEATRQHGAPWGGHLLLLCGPLVTPFCVIPTLKNPINRETPRNKPRTSPPLPQASIPKKP